MLKQKPSFVFSGTLYVYLFFFLNTKRKKALKRLYKSLRRKATVMLLEALAQFTAVVVQYCSTRDGL